MSKKDDSSRQDIVPFNPEDSSEQFEHIIDKVKPPLTKEQKEQIEKVLGICISQSISVSQMRAGPLPHPSEFEKYEKVLPGSANRILEMAENQSNHRQEIEKKIVSSDSFVQNSGAIFAFIIALVIIIGSMALIFIGKDVVGLIGIITALVSLVSVFFIGKYQQQKQLQNKKKSKS